MTRRPNRFATAEAARAARERLQRTRKQKETTMATYWVSFADEDACLGVVIVDETDDSDAESIVRKTIELNANPGGGDVQIQKIPGHDIPQRFKNRLLTKAEVDLLNAGVGSN